MFGKDCKGRSSFLSVGRTVAQKIHAPLLGIVIKNLFETRMSWKRFWKLFIANNQNSPTCRHRRSQGEPRGRWPPKMFKTSSHFVLWEVVFQTK